MESRRRKPHALGPQSVIALEHPRVRCVLWILTRAGGGLASDLIAELRADGLENRLPGVGTRHVASRERRRSTGNVCRLGINHAPELSQPGVLDGAAWQPIAGFARPRRRDHPRPCGRSRFHDVLNALGMPVTPGGEVRRDDCRHRIGRVELLRRGRGCGSGINSFQRMSRVKHSSCRGPRSFHAKRQPPFRLST